MRQPQQNMTNINPKYFWIHRLVSAPGGTLLLVPIMTFFPRKSEREKRSNTQLERQVPSRTQIQYVTAASTNCNREVTYALWDSWFFSSSIVVPLEFTLSTNRMEYIEHEYCKDGCWPVKNVCRVQAFCRSGRQRLLF